jgi:hypothetical protein
VLDAELTNKFSIWRAKATAGTLTTEEMKEAILALRGSRRTAADAAKATKSRAKGPTRSADDLLGELEGL